MYKQEIVYDKPLFIGTTILDLSKLHMMKFHYNVIDKEFNNKYDLIYSDTDSLIYNIKTDDIYEWIKKNKDHFDLGGSQRKDLKDDKNNKELGVMKDEAHSLIITEGLFLNPKCYSYKYQDKINDKIYKNKKTCKGVSKATVKYDIDHNDYVNVLYDLNEDKVLKKDVVSIRSFNHELFSYFQNKVALTPYYDKLRMVDNINNVPYGYES
jgi:hypothetical protein